jgi:hypothetical protein
MRLYDEIFKSVDGLGQARCIFVPDGEGYFQGVKSVGDFSSERIILYFPKLELEIEGQNLSIAKYCDGDLRLAGKIVSVRLMKDGNGR